MTQKKPHLVPTSPPPLGVDAIASCRPDHSGRQDHLLYKLNGGGSYGLDVSFTDALDIDEREMSVVFPFADGRRRDGVGDLLEVGGIRTERHRVNPIVLFDHGKSVSLPIAKAEDASGNYTVVIDPANQVATCKAYFYQCKECDSDDHAVFCEQLFDLVAKKFLRGGSIGYQIVQARELPPDYERGTPKGLHLLSTLMLEASIVVTPANMDTVRKALSMPKVCGKSLSPYLVKSLTPYLPERKVVVSVKGQPSDDISPDKARQILHDGEVNGHPLTDKQRRMFGAAASQGDKAFDAELDQREAEAKNKASASKLPHVRDGMYFCTECSKRYFTDAKARKCCGSSGVMLARGRKAGKDLVRVPLDEDLSETDVPPARWKPGVGAVSKAVSLRLKYRSPKGVPMAVKAFPDQDEEKKDTPEDTPEDTPPPADDAPADPGMNPEAGKGGEFGNPDEPLQDTDADGISDPVDPMPMGQDQPIEKLSAQVIRRMHKDALLLMGEYDQFLQLLEHEPTAQFVQSYLQSLEKTLSALEQIFTSHHGDLPPIENAMGPETPEGVDPNLPEGDVSEGDEEVEEGTNAVPADSAPTDEEPTPEEAIEGMKQETPTEKADDSGDSEDDDRPRKKGEKSLQSCQKCPCGKKRGQKCGCGSKSAKEASEESEDASEKEMSDDTASEPPADPEEGSEEDTQDTTEVEKSTPPEVKGRLALHEKSMCKEVHGFLNELSTLRHVSEEHRFKSYHYHKVLEGIAQFRDDVSQAQQPDQKSIPGGYNWVQEEAQETMHPHRKWCRDCSHYLGRLSREKAFGDPHRQEALLHLKAMEMILNSNDDEKELVGDSAPDEANEEIDNESGPEGNSGEMESKEVDEREFHKFYQENLQALEALKSDFTSLSLLVN